VRALAGQHGTSPKTCFAQAPGGLQVNRVAHYAERNRSNPVCCNLLGRIELEAWSRSLMSSRSIDSFANYRQAHRHLFDRRAGCLYLHREQAHSFSRSGDA
jgi:hypothetical protein